MIQAPQHVGNPPPPLIKQARSVPRKRLAGQQGLAVVRAIFSMSGAFQEAQVIEGPPGLAKQLAAEIELERLPGFHHRTDVFAVFDLAAGSELISAYPVYPQCCCGGEGTPCI